MANEQWRARVQRAQQMAAERLGVDAAIMQPPRQPDGGGAAAHSAEAEAEPVAVAEVAQPETVAATEPATAVVAETQPAAAESAAAQRVAAAKARAASKSSGANGAPAAAPVAPSKPAARPAPAAAPAKEVVVETEVGQPGINRREFLTYAWGAALGLLTLEMGVGTYFFTYPRFRAGEFGGAFPLPMGEIPAVESCAKRQCDR